MLTLSCLLTSFLDRRWYKPERKVGESTVLGWLELTSEEVSLAVPSHRCHDSSLTSQPTLQACASASMHIGTGRQQVLSLKSTEDLKYYRQEAGNNPSFPYLSQHEIRHTKQFEQPPILRMPLKETTAGRGPGSPFSLSVSGRKETYQSLAGPLSIKQRKSS